MTGGSGTPVERAVLDPARPDPAWLDPARLDPEVAAGLAELPPVLDARRGIAAFAPDPAHRVMPAVDDPALEIVDERVPGRPGDPPVPTRSYVPRGRTAQAGRGVLVLHGGGFISGSPALADPTLRMLSRTLDAVVVAPTYRLAPADPHPAAFDDAWAVLTWMAGQRDDLGFDADRLVVFGVSAGAALAAALCLHARDRTGPPIAAQVLGFPSLDDRMRTPSSRAVHDPRVWNTGMNRLAWDAYVGHLDDVPPTAAPARATDLGGLPPATVTVDEHDPLRDEGVDWARRLREAGVPTTLHEVPGTFHGSMGFVPDAAVSRAELSALVAGIERA